MSNSEYLENKISQTLSNEEELLKTDSKYDLEILKTLRRNNKTQYGIDPSTTTKLPDKTTKQGPRTSSNPSTVAEEVLEVLIKAPNGTAINIVKTINLTSTSGVNPTRDTLQQFGFTSGHQNNFGVPIEEDERILKLLNEELIRIQNGTTTPRLISTTLSENYRTKVSPTLPLIKKFEHTTETLKAIDEGTCMSTSLPLCKGILHYDLTINRTNTLSSQESEHFKYLIDSQCSARTPQFICSLKEPECRPSKMGILQPCKRFCKCEY